MTARSGSWTRPICDLRIGLAATSQPPAVIAAPQEAHTAGRSLAAVLPHVGAVHNLGRTSRQIADTAAGHIDAFREHGVDDANLLGGAWWPPERAC